MKAEQLGYSVIFHTPTHPPWLPFSVICWPSRDWMVPTFRENLPSNSFFLSLHPSTSAAVLYPFRPFCSCRLWSAVNSHQAGQVEDKRKRRHTAADLWTERDRHTYLCMWWYSSATAVRSFSIQSKLWKICFLLVWDNLSKIHSVRPVIIASCFNHLCFILSMWFGLFLGIRFFNIKSNIKVLSGENRVNSR